MTFAQVRLNHLLLSLTKKKNLLVSMVTKLYGSSVEAEYTLCGCLRTFLETTELCKRAALANTSQAFISILLTISQVTALQTFIAKPKYPAAICATSRATCSLEKCSLIIKLPLRGNKEPAKTAASCWAFTVP